MECVTLGALARLHGPLPRETESAAMTFPPRNLAVQVHSRDSLDVREFSVQQRMSSLFEITLVALSDNADIDFDAVVGQPASFRIQADASGPVPVRVWTGICKHIQQIAVEEAGLSTYRLTLVPTLWFTTQRRNHRMFQQLSELDIARKILAEWGIEPELRITGTYKTRKYRVQYAESDFAFLSRMLEDAGISYCFEQGDTETRLVLSDAPQSSERRTAPIAFRDHPTTSMDHEYVTHVHIGQRVRPGRYTLRDHDSRLAASYKLLASAEAPEAGIEGRLERFHYAPGAFLFGTDQGEDNPHADDKGKTRTDTREGAAIAKRRLEAKRASARVCSFETNVMDLSPGVVMSLLDHPRSDLAEGKPLLVVEATHTGTVDGPWTHRCEVRPADIAFRPALSTPKPKISGVESATVVGPAGQEIHTDEFGRVRVHFHWDRESGMDENSSCWIHVSQPWGGAGYGGSNLPRIGQEVLVDFLGGDPDRPVITGRVYTNLQKSPYKLPDNKTQSGWKSSSSPATGGYNEIMFEDAAGLELVRMQAEKDLHKLVKNDEDVTIGHDRAKLVKNDDALTVGNDRTKLVKNDENVTIGNNRTRLVQVDDALTVGNNRTKVVESDENVTIGHDRSRSVKNDDDLTVGNSRSKLVQMNEREIVGVSRTRVVGVNENVDIGMVQSVNVGIAQSIAVGVDQSITVGAAQTVAVGADQSITVGAAQSTAVGAARSVTVGGADTLMVTLASAETVGITKALTVGGAYQITVGGAMSTKVVGTQAEDVGLSKTVKAGEKIEIVCGKAKIVLEKSGNITLVGVKISIDGETLTAKTKADMSLESAGGDVVIKGGPMVRINS
jgi:type VI secretion system secreted protein VgrG